MNVKIWQHKLFCCHAIKIHKHRLIKKCPPWAGSRLCTCLGNIFMLCHIVCAMYFVKDIELHIALLLIRTHWMCKWYLAYKYLLYELIERILLFKCIYFNSLTDKGTICLIYLSCPLTFASHSTIFVSSSKYLENNPWQPVSLGWPPFLPNVWIRKELHSRLIRYMSVQNLFFHLKFEYTIYYMQYQSVW